MPRAKKTASAKAPAKKALRSRFKETADAVDEPQPGASQPEEPAATQSRAKSTAKKPTTTRQTKRKVAAEPEPEPKPPKKATAAKPPKNAGGDEGESGPGPAAGSSTPAVKKKAARTPAQGTRASSRLKGKEAEVVKEPAPPVQPETKRTNRKRKPATTPPVQDKDATPPVENKDTAPSFPDTKVKFHEEDDEEEDYEEEDYEEDYDEEGYDGEDYGGEDHGGEDPGEGPSTDSGLPAMIELPPGVEPPPQYVRVQKRFYLRKMGDGSTAIALGLFPVEDAN